LIYDDETGEMVTESEHIKLQKQRDM
jgi:hypothetical protein